MNYLTLIFPVITVCALVYFFCYYWRVMRPKSPIDATLEWVATELDPQKGLKSHPMVKKDYIVLTVILLVATFLNFFKLGDVVAPQSFYSFDDQSNQVTLEFREPVEIGGIMSYTGIYTGTYNVEFSDDGEEWIAKCEIEQKHSKVLQWLDAMIPGEGEEDEPTEIEESLGRTRYLRLTSDKTPIEMGELVIYDAGGEIIGLDNISNASDYRKLFDERELIPEHRAYTNGTYFDEIYYARTAYELINGIKPYETTHPPLGKLIIMIGVEIFGLTPFGWRFMGALFGVLMLWPLYVLIKNLFGKTVIAVCGTLIFTFDFMHYVQTRICTIDTYSVFFVILMYLFMYRYISQDYDTPFKKTLPPLILSGLSFGLGAAAKWTSIYAGAGLLILYIVHMVKRCKYHRANEQKIAGFIIKTLLSSAVFYLIIPLIIYYLSYIPYASAHGYGSDISVIFTEEYWEMFINNQTHMFSYHSQLESEHAYSSTWYMWIFDARPILYFRHIFDNGTKSLFASFNNPIVTWGGLMAMFSLFVSYFRKRDDRALVVVIGYLSQLVPWIIITRIAFSYHYFTCIIFLVLAICHVLNNIWEKKRGRYKLAVYGFTGAVVGVFIMFYPVLSGITVSSNYAYYFLRWFPSWPL